MSADDLAIADLAADAEFWKDKYIRERSVSIVYHELATATFDALRESERQRKRDRAERARLEDELVRLRTDILERGAAA